MSLLRRLIISKFSAMPAMAPFPVYLTESQHAAIEANIRELNKHSLKQQITKSAYIVSILELAGLFEGTMGRPKTIVKNRTKDCRSIGVYLTEDQIELVKERAKSEGLSVTALVVSIVESFGGFLEV